MSESRLKTKTIYLEVLVSDEKVATYYGETSPADFRYLSEQIGNLKGVLSVSETKHEKLLVRAAVLNRIASEFQEALKKSIGETYEPT